MRNLRNSFLALAAAVMIGMVAVPQARASEMDKKTFVTFHEAMEIPGMVLPSGDYVMKRADNNLPDVIRCTNRAENHVYATVFAIPTYRQVPTSDVVIVTEERPANQPEAIKKWFYPGDTVGAEFIYPKSRERLMAMNTTTFSQPTAPEPEPRMTESAPTPIEVQPESTPAPEPEIAQNTAPPAPTPSSTTTTQPATTTQEPASTSQQLPQTASNLELIALCGLIFAGMGLGLRTFARHLS